MVQWVRRISKDIVWLEAHDLASAQVVDSVQLALLHFVEPQRVAPEYVLCNAHEALEHLLLALDRRAVHKRKHPRQQEVQEVASCHHVNDSLSQRHASVTLKVI